MKKYVVEVFHQANEDMWNEIKYAGNDAKEAIELWAELEREYPTCVSISAPSRDIACELIDYAYNNMDWLEQICSKRKFPYKFNYIQDAIGCNHETGCVDFQECPYKDIDEYYRDQIHPFDMG